MLTLQVLNLLYLVKRASLHAWHPWWRLWSGFLKFVPCWPKYVVGITHSVIKQTHPKTKFHVVSVLNYFAVHILQTTLWKKSFQFIKFGPIFIENVTWQRRQIVKKEKKLINFVQLFIAMCLHMYVHIYAHLKSVFHLMYIPKHISWWPSIANPGRKPSASASGCRLGKGLSQSPTYSTGPAARWGLYRVNRWVCEKFSQNVAQPIFC
jgi:hypothetical protein